MASDSLRISNRRIGARTTQLLPASLPLSSGKRELAVGIQIAEAVARPVMTCFFNLFDHGRLLSDPGGRGLPNFSGSCVRLIRMVLPSSQTTMKSIVLASLLSLALLAPSVAQPATVAPPSAQGEAAQSKVGARPAEWAKPIDQSRNLYEIAPGLYRSAQPEQRDAAQLQRLGIRTIINFRAHHRDEDALNLPDVKLVRIPMDTWWIGDDQIVSALRAIEQSQKDGPVLIHCQHGADRTGVVSAMYRILVQGWSREQASRELERGNFGFHGIWVNIPHYLKHVNIEGLRARMARAQR